MPTRVERSPFERAVAGGLTGPSSKTSSTAEKKSNAPKDGEWIDPFLSAIMQGSSVTDATTQAGVHITLPYKRRTTDEAFGRAWREAAEIGTELMEQEAARRAYHGTLKPVYHKGVECGRIREYSDTLMIFLLKARKPEKYRDNDEGRGGGGNTVIGTINVQNNLQAAALIRGMVERGELGVIEEVRAPAVPSALGDSGQRGEVETGGAPAGHQQRAGEGVEDAQQ